MSKLKIEYSRHNYLVIIINLFQCAKRVALNIDKIKSCVQTEEGDKLLAEYGDKTWKLNPNLSFVPTVIYNGVYNDDSQWQSLKDFVAVVCSKLGEPKLDICLNKKLPVTDSFFW